MTVTVTPSGDGPGGTIPLSITRGTAEADDVGTPGTLTLAAGKKAGTTTVPTRVDADADDETFTVALGSNLPLPYIAGSKTSVEITLNDIVSLGTPTNLSIDPTINALEVSWMEPVGITPTGYDVHYTAAATSTAGNDAAAGTNPATQWVPATTRPTTRTRERISGLTAQTDYRIRVRSRHGSTTSDWAHTNASTWLLWAHSEPRCNTTVTDTTVEPRIALSLSPRPARTSTPSTAGSAAKPRGSGSSERPFPAPACPRGRASVRSPSCSPTTRSSSGSSGAARTCRASGRPARGPSVQPRRSPTRSPSRTSRRSCRSAPTRWRRARPSP